MATLTNAQRRFIVIALAEYNSPTEVAEMVAEEFGVEVTRQQVHHYNPTKSNGNAGLADEWVELFHTTRRVWREAYYEEALSSLRVRLRETRRILEKAVEDGDFEAALRALKQAAKDEGGQFQNVRILEHQGPNGGPIRTESSVDLSRLPTEDLKLLKQLKRRAATVEGGGSGGNGDRP